MTERRTDWVVRTTPLDVAAEAAGRFAEAARRAVEARGRFAVALSGGSTPAVLFELLASQGWRARVPWERTHVFWSDERCVPPDHEDSNYGLAERTLLRHVRVPAAQVHRIRGETGPSEAAEAYERDLRAFAGPGHGSSAPLDLVLLGVGDDGHTASLFPGSEADRRDAAGDDGRWVLPNADDVLGVPRVTLATAAINAAPDVFFLVTGASKAEIVSHLADPPAAGTRELLPALRVRPAGRLTWLLDDAAARLADIPGDPR